MVSSKKQAKKSGRKLSSPTKKKAASRKQAAGKRLLKTPPKKPPKQTSPLPKTVPVQIRMPPRASSGLREVLDQSTGQKMGTGYRMATDRIDGETVIGDLIVVFPRTREALLRHGLKLDVDEAGDIYMTLDAFAAIHGLKTSALVEELTEVSRQPPPVPQPVGQQQQRVPQLAAPPSAT